MIIKKEKIKLPNGLTVYISEKEELYKCSGNTRKFSICDIKDGNKSIAHLYKMIELNGVKIKENWRA